jgi:hypothetical protein
VEIPNEILGLSGRKQCGKNTTANYILGLTMRSLGLVRTGFMITEKGKLWVNDILGNTDFAGVFDIERNNPTVADFKKNYLDEAIRFYSFADLLKQEVCMDVLGLTRAQCYGSDDDKNTPTQYVWENMPSQSTIDKTGAMTAREVMQFVGTDLFRMMNSNVWVDACIRRIQKDKPTIAIITDVRFPNEVMGIKNAGGKVMRMTRNPAGDSDTHASETALDKENFDWSNFDFVIENHHGNISTHCRLVSEAMKDEWWFPQIQEEEDN